MANPIDNPLVAPDKAYSGRWRVQIYELVYDNVVEADSEEQARLKADRDMGRYMLSDEGESHIVVTPYREDEDDLELDEAKQTVDELIGPDVSFSPEEKAQGLDVADILSEATEEELKIIIEDMALADKIELLDWCFEEGLQSVVIEDNILAAINGMFENIKLDHILPVLTRIISRSPELRSIAKGVIERV